LAAVLALGAGGARADDTELRRALSDLRAEYDARIAVLESEVAALRGSVPGPHGHGAEYPDPPLLSIRGFGSVDYGASTATDRTGSGARTSSNEFSLGDLDVFITSQIDEDVSFLAETLFEFKEDGEVVVDVERLQAKYHATDWLTVAAGRGHTAVGYWNHRFHHGEWLQTTAERPLIVDFEDEGGILPLHFVGLEFEGDFDLGTASLSYVANLANGRGETTEELTLIDDLNSQKLVSLMLSFHPTGSEDVGFGIDVLHDRIPPAPGVDPSRSRRIDELIYGGFVFYEVHPFEFIGELQTVSHRDHTSDAEFDHLGGYVQVARALGAWKPYYRYEFLDLESGDPYYFDFDEGEPITETTVGHLLGVRWDVWSYLALKAELFYTRASSERERGARIQSSFAF
jgi:hypothetical protein